MFLNKAETFNYFLFTVASTDNFKWYFPTLELMVSKFNFEEIKERYKEFYAAAIERGDQYIPIYGVQSWDTVLNDVDLCIFQDIRILNLSLYPIFPISENSYLHFANPFKRIGIEIVYKNSPKSLIERKVELLKAQRWTIYTIESRDSYLAVEEFFRLKRLNDDIEFEELGYDLRLIFFEKYFKENANCLLYYIKMKYFEGNYERNLY